MKWKGLNTTITPVFLGYDQVERMIAALLDRAIAWKPDVVVGIERGGLIPATMVAGIMALPLAIVRFDRVTSMMTWVGDSPSCQRILLVDDGCSTGRTMAAVRQVLLREQRQCLTLAVVHDPDVTQYVPDLSHPMQSLWRFPWERGEATPAGRALRATGAGPARETELPFYGIELDGILAQGVLRAPDRNGGPSTTSISDLLPSQSLPFFSRQRAVVITRRAESDRELIAKWLGRSGYSGLSIECRPTDVSLDPESIALYKAKTATCWGCTHFIESDAQEALRLAACAPHLIVDWWSGAECRAWVVAAAATPVSSGPIAAGTSVARL